MFSLKDPSTTGVACKKAKVNCRLQIYICSAEDAMVDRRMSGAFTQSQPGFLQLRFHPSGDRKELSKREMLQITRLFLLLWVHFDILHNHFTSCWCRRENLMIQLQQYVITPVKWQWEEWSGEGLSYNFGALISESGHSCCAAGALISGWCKWQPWHHPYQRLFIPTPMTVRALISTNP